MLPSEFPEVQARAHLKLLLAEHVDMQFDDVRTMLRLPIEGLTGGCNFAATAVLFNIVSGCSVCFYNASAKALAAARQAGCRFKGLLGEFYPWVGEPLSKAEGVALLYKATRNPLTHRLGLDEPPSGASKGNDIALKKWPLKPDEVAELEDSAARPAWALPTITTATSPRGADQFTISVPALYWGVHRMLRALFADPTHAARADALAKKFGPLWGKYLTPGPASLTITGHAPTVSVGPGRADPGRIAEGGGQT